MTLLSNLKIASRAKLCLVSAFPDIVKDYPKMSNLPKIFLRRLENVGRDYFENLKCGLIQRGGGGGGRR